MRLIPSTASLFPIALGFVAGYVDTVGFVALFGLFTAHVTGNFVLIGAALAHSSGGVLLKLLAFPAFIVAVATSRLIAVGMERRGHPALRVLLLLQLVLLCGFGVLGWIASPVRSPDALLVELAGLSAAAAMGVQNAAARLVLPTFVPTTVMTGNVTQLVLDAVDILRGAADEPLRRRLAKLVWPVAAFGVGAIGGAFAFVSAGFYALLLPITIIGALTATPLEAPAMAAER